MRVIEYSNQKHQAFQFKPDSHSDSNRPLIPIGSSPMNPMTVRPAMSS